MTESEAQHEAKVFRSDKITVEKLDPDALKVIRRLKELGYEAYFVGGCVRDLLLGIQPKDFDIATSAHPRDIRHGFRNCRIIGKRFKLAHVVFGKKIIEAATFRGKPNEDNTSENQDLLIREDNVFGTAEEDAKRRDFTINALFYDPETEQVIDYVDGVADIERRLVRSIGDPEIRIREDPVRILRAIKFSTRLDLALDDPLHLAMRTHVLDLARCAPARILEEMFRLLKGGYGAPAFRKLRDFGALQMVLPELDLFLDEEEKNVPDAENLVQRFWKGLEQLDASVAPGKIPSSALVLSCLFYPLFLRQLQKETRSIYDPSQILLDLMLPLAQRTRLPRFDLGRAQRICVVQRRFTQKPGRRFRPHHFAAQDFFPEALEFFRIQALSRGLDLNLYNRWADRLRDTRSTPRQLSQGEPIPESWKAPQENTPIRKPSPEQETSWGDW